MRTTPIRQNEDMLCAVEEAEPGEPLQLTVARGGDLRQKRLVRVTPVARKELRATAAAEDTVGGAGRWGW